MVGEMETKEKPKPTPDYLMQLMNDKKLMSSLPNFCGIFNHLERLLDEGEAPPGPAGPRPGGGAPSRDPTRARQPVGRAGRSRPEGTVRPGTVRPGRGRAEAAPRPGSRGAADGPGSAARVGPAGGDAARGLRRGGCTASRPRPRLPAAPASSATAGSSAGLPGRSPAPRPAGA